MVSTNLSLRTSRFFRADEAAAEEIEQCWSSVDGILTVADVSALVLYTPWKINMEHNHGGLEDHVPFKMGDL